MPSVQIPMPFGLPRENQRDTDIAQLGRDVPTDGRQLPKFFAVAKPLALSDRSQASPQ
jgi:hypothetical protein